jgi:hypothetical protein
VGASPAAFDPLQARRNRDRAIRRWGQEVDQEST